MSKTFFSLFLSSLSSFLSFLQKSSATIDKTTYFNLEIFIIGKEFCIFLSPSFFQVLNRPKRNSILSRKSLFYLRTPFILLFLQKNP